MALLEVKGLEVYYGVIQALKGIDFEVNEGEIVTLIGANGAGKTTTMQSVIGLIPPKAGTVSFEGKDITHLHCHKIVSLGMSQVPEGRRIFQELIKIFLWAHISKRIKRLLKRILKKYMNVFRDLRNAKIRLQVLSRAASSRCLLWAERL